MDDVARLRGEIALLKRWVALAATAFVVLVIFAGFLLARWWTEREVEARAVHWSAGHDSATLDGIRSDINALRAEVKREGEVSAAAVEAVDRRVDDLRSRVDQKLDETSRKLDVHWSTIDFIRHKLAVAGVMDPRWGGETQKERVESGGSNTTGGDP